MKKPAYELPSWDDVKTAELRLKGRNVRVECIEGKTQTKAPPNGSTVVVLDGRVCRLIVDAPLTTRRKQWKRK